MSKSIDAFLHCRVTEIKVFIVKMVWTEDACDFTSVPSVPSNLTKQH